MRSIVALLLLGLATAAISAQEKPRVPEDSVELTVVGCLEGRALSTVEGREVDVVRGPYAGGRVFRLAGKREVMAEVKRENGHLVEATGLVKRSALDDRGMKVGSRVEINGGPPVSRSGMPSIGDTVPVMDVTSIRRRSTSCGG